MSGNPPVLDKNLVRRHFGRAASGYEATAVLQDRVGQDLVDRLSFMRLAPQWILDLGAGTGLQSRRLNRLYPRARVLALDLAWPMLGEARSRKSWRQRQYYLQADAEHLPLRDAAMDLVFSNLSLQWVNDLDATLGGLRRVIRPGGLLLFTTLGPDTLKELRQSFGQLDGHAHVNPFLDMHDLGDALVRNGFSGPVLDVEHHVLTYASVDGLLRDLRGIGAGNALAGRRQGLWTPRGLQRLRGAYEAWRMPDGRLPAHYEVIHAHAWVPEDGPAGREPAPETRKSLRFWPRGAAPGGRV